MQQIVAFISAMPFDFVSVGNLIIALAALTFTLWQACVQRRHDRLKVRPKIVMFYRSDGKSASIGIKNNGIGPAELKRLRLWKREDNGLHTEIPLPTFEHLSHHIIDQFSNELRAVKQAVEVHRNGVVADGEIFKQVIIAEGLILQPGEELTFVELYAPFCHDKRLSGMLEKFTIGVEFRSLYGEKFEIPEDA